MRKGARKSTYNNSTPRQPPLHTSLLPIIPHPPFRLLDSRGPARNRQAEYCISNLQRGGHRQGASHRRYRIGDERAEAHDKHAREQRREGVAGGLREGGLADLHRAQRVGRG